MHQQNENNLFKSSLTKCERTQLPGFKYRTSTHPTEEAFQNIIISGSWRYSSLKRLGGGGGRAIYSNLIQN